jgi:hypothetical protein
MKRGDLFADLGIDGREDNIRLDLKERVCEVID